MTKTNFTFRTNKQLKDHFVEQAKANNTNASKLINQWMEDYINGKKPSTDNAQTAQTEESASAIAQLEHRINQLESDNAQTAQTEESAGAIAQLETRINQLESQLSNDSDHWHGVIEDSLSALFEKRLSQLESNQDYLIEKKLESAILPQLEGICCSIEKGEASTDSITQQQLRERLAALWDSLLDVIENKGKEEKEDDRSRSKNSKHKQLNLMDSFPTPNLEQPPIVIDEESTIKDVEGSAIATEDKFLEDLSKNTPTENTLEDTKETHQDESHLKPPEPLEPQFSEEILVVKARDSQQERDLSGGKRAKNLSGGKSAKKSPEEKGISVEAIAKQVSISAPTIRTILKGGGSADSRQTYQLEVERYYTWDSDTSRFFPKH